MSFKIVSVSRVSEETVSVKVRMDAKAWLKAKRDKALGALYGVDISNEVYRTFGVKAYNPTVADRDNASGGIKWITLYYADNTWTNAPNNVIYVDFVSKKRINAA